MALVFVAFGAGSVTWRGLGGGFAVAALVSLVLLLLSAAVSFADVSILLGFWLALGCVVAATIRPGARSAGVPAGGASRME